MRYHKSFRTLKELVASGRLGQVVTADQIEQWLKVSREAGVLHRQDQPGKHWKLYQLEEVLQSDPQLQTALLCLQGSIMARALQGEPELELVGPVSRAGN